MGSDQHRSMLRVTELLSHAKIQTIRVKLFMHFINLINIYMHVLFT